MEAISLFGTILSIITTFRDAFPSLASDATDWKNYEFFDRARWVKLLKIIKNIEKWQWRWMVYSEEAGQQGSLQSKFWGSSASEITEHVKCIQDEVAKLQKLLNTRRIDRGGGCFGVFRKKGRDVLFRSGGNINRILETLDTLVLGLDTMSDEAYWRLWRRQDFGEKEPRPPETSALHQFGHQHHLVKLAMHTWLTSNQLRDCCLGRGRKLELDIELDLFFRQRPHDGVEPRSQVIAEASQTKSLGYTLLVSQPDYMNRRKRIRLTPDPTRVPERCKTLFSEAFDVVSGHAGGGEAGLELVTKGQRVTMKLEELQNVVGNLPEPTSLRSQLSSQSARESLDDPVRKIDHQIWKMKRAFHISEFCLLFFKSKWMSWVCSCNIQEYDLSSLDTTTNSTFLVDQRYLFAVKGLSSDDKDVPPAACAAAPATPNGSGNGTATLKPCWCQSKLSDDPKDKNVASSLQRYPLFSLGLILVEIGLGRPLQEIQVNKAVVDVNSIFFGYHDSSTSDPIVKKSLEELRPIFNDVLADDDDDEDNKRAKKAGSDFYSAVKFCLKSRDPPGVDKTKLEEFFVEVVWKLHNIQKDLIEQRDELLRNKGQQLLPRKQTQQEA
ncbi:hypothetical protein QC761_303370 [Podospora bellae-mahoneyi]|uniref:Prion-inhibition and propagation HeLo domain-containing protein n=1 Tax=Podospora bellae-mahoneyi TaxID=2093777 RepID=A0ABR0FKQ0_9PEZI|nr:hypothetical protein QC761_303370 [Podospora bellae-mahoneyi]